MDYIVKAIIPIIIALITTYGVVKKVKVYECFIDGAKEGLTICIKIFPYLLAMLVAIGLFRESKALDWFTYIIKPIVGILGIPPEVVPLILIKPLSGSGAFGVFAEILNKFGPDSYIGRVSSVIMGSTETIFYTLTVYFGAIGVKKIRHTLWAAILADLVSIVIAITIVRIML
ncbi:spore maturation protein [Clostridium sp. DJ247]|uniref:spore maturation protein n=1 Tax=Clostridium sp. DJ247 TaxID=2726188 RepID=UPI00162638B0|nr:spore maturation protein [Clostridium sp. DJ247]MBC2581268.1 spore maturation protein [Clostridium sp. DJ247]